MNFFSKILIFFHSTIDKFKDLVYNRHKLTAYVEEDDNMMSVEEAVKFVQQNLNYSITLDGKIVAYTKKTKKTKSNKKTK